MVDPMTPVLFLVHGAHAGAWVWEDVTSHLKAPWRAVDLPGHGARREPLGGVTFDACVAAVVEAAADTKRVVLVGHSMGVPVVLAAADQIGSRLAHVVCIAGAVPRPGASMVDSFPFVPRIVSRIVLHFQSEVFSQPESIARNSLLNGCPPDKVERACKRFTMESTKVVTAPVAWSGKTPARATYVKCLRDKGAMNAGHQSEMAARLGAAVVAMDTCHYPMIEKPADLAALLERAAS